MMRYVSRWMYSVQLAPAAGLIKPQSSLNTLSCEALSHVPVDAENSGQTHTVLNTQRKRQNGELLLVSLLHGYVQTHTRPGRPSTTRR